MDLPEQPTVWPPAPNIAPPESAKAKSRRKLIMPEWISYWYRSGIGLVAISYIVCNFCETDHIPIPRWGSFPVAMGAWFVVGGLLTLWKYWPRRKRN